MSVFRINKDKNYTVMSNYHLRDKNLSYKAKGLLSFMLSLPDDWDYSMNGLCKVSKENVRAIRSTLHELEEFGYLARERTQNEKGQFGYNYSIYEYPTIQVPHTHNPHTDNANTQDDLQINTNEINTKKQIDKVDKHFNPITMELIVKKYLKEDDLELYKYDNFINEMLEEYEYREVIMAVNYIIQKWKLNKGLDENGELITNQYGYFKSALESNLRKITQDIELWEIEP